MPTVSAIWCQEASLANFVTSSGNVGVVVYALGVLIWPHVGKSRGGGGKASIIAVADDVVRF